MDFSSTLQVNLQVEDIVTEPSTLKMFLYLGFDKTLMNVPAYRVGSYAEVDLFVAGFYLCLYSEDHRLYSAQISRHCRPFVGIAYRNTFSLAFARNNSNASNNTCIGR